MKIETRVVEDGVLWMKVLGDEVTDLPTAIAALDSDQRRLFDGYVPRPAQYRPVPRALREGFKFGDHFGFEKLGRLT